MTVGALLAPFEAGISPTTSGRPLRSSSPAVPPARSTNPATHSAARRTSPACAGSALTLGMASSSASSSNQVRSISPRSLRGALGRELPTSGGDVPSPRKTDGGGQAGGVEHALERVDRGARGARERAGRVVRDEVDLEHAAVE